jgi:hypothetical protein
MLKIFMLALVLAFYGGAAFADPPRDGAAATVDRDDISKAT